MSTFWFISKKLVEHLSVTSLRFLERWQKPVMSQRWCLASHFMTACLCGICSCSKLKTSSFAHILFVPFCLEHTHHSSGGTQAETEGQLSKYYSGSRKLSVEPIAVYKLLLEHRKKGRYPEDTVDMQGNIQSKTKVRVAWATYYLFLK